MNWFRWLALLSMVVMFGMVVLIFALPVPTSTEGEIKVCDRAVSALLTSTDAVELQRAEFLVRRLNCDIGWRLDATGAFKPRDS